MNLWLFFVAFSNFDKKYFQIQMKLEDDLGDTPEVQKLIQELEEICS